MSLPRFYPVVCTTACERNACDPLTVSKVLTEAGAGILQFRHKSDFDRSAFEMARAIAEVCRQAGTIFVVNDRADVAAMLDADVHLGQDDLPPVAARRVVGSARKIGFSTHNESQMRAAAGEPVDFVAFGPVFATSSKDNPDPVVGAAGLTHVRPLCARPLIAIGGITLETAQAAWDAGADSVAVIGNLFAGTCQTHELRRRAEEWIELSRK